MHKEVTQLGKSVLHVAWVLHSNVLDEPTLELKIVSPNTILSETVLAWIEHARDDDDKVINGVYWSYGFDPEDSGDCEILDKTTTLKEAIALCEDYVFQKKEADVSKTLEQLYEEAIAACKAYNAVTDDEDNQIFPIHIGDVPEGVTEDYGETLVKTDIIDEYSNEQIALRSSAH